MSRTALSAIRNQDGTVLLCDDVAVMAQFYRDVLGFELRNETPIGCQCGASCSSYSWLPRNRQFRAIAIIALCLALLLASCGSSIGQEAALDGDDALSVDIDPSSTSPLADFLGLDVTDADAVKTSQIRIESEAGTIAQRCMLENGFEFTPPRSTGRSPLGSAGEDLPAGSDEWVSKYGFGITTLYLPQAMVGDLVGIPDAELPITSEDVEELNRAYTESLGEAEREAYNVALRGPQSDSGEAQGCIGEAFQHIRTAGTDVQGLLAAFGDALDEHQKRIDADPRVIEYYASLSVCVANDGLTFGGFYESNAELSTALDEVQQFIEADDAGQQMLNAEGRVLLAELQSRELALAESVVGCGGGPDATNAALGSIVAEYEREFVRENAEELAEFRPQGS